MSLLQMKLNRDLPFGQVFQGTGEPDARDTAVKFYQHGLYFLANGNLAVESPHNASKMALIESLGGINPEEAPKPIQEPDRTPVNPEIVNKLADKSDEEVHGIALKMVDALHAQNVPFDYTPALDNRDGNIRFIAQYAS